MLISALQPPSLRALTMTLLAALFVAGCASKTSVSSTWHEPKVTKPRYQNVIIVGVTESTDSRMTFEDAVAYDLRGPNTMAWSSARQMLPDPDINEENLRQLVLDKGADAVIVTKVTSMDVKAVESGGRSDTIEYQQNTGIGMTPQQRTGNVFLYNYNEKIEPVYVTREYTLALTTEVYNAANGELVYTVTSTATKQETIGQVIDVLSDVIAKRLRDDGVIR
jgi:hypothetical protein